MEYLAPQAPSTAQPPLPRRASRRLHVAGRLWRPAEKVGAERRHKKGCERQPPAPLSLSTWPPACGSRASRATRTPPFVVALANSTSIRHRRHFHPDFELFVTLDRGFFRPATLFAPDEREHIIDVDVRIHHTQGQSRALVVAVAAEHREPDGLPAHGDLVIRRGRIIRDRQIEELVLLTTRHEQRRIDLRKILAIPGEGHLLPLRLPGDLLQRLASDEIMVELDERTVPQLVRRHVIVFDVVRHEAAADRPRALISARRQPLAILLHLLPRVHSR